MLDILEKGERRRPVPIVDDLPLFSVARGMEEEAKAHPAVKALERIYALKHWPMFRDRFGDFHIEAPVSPAMLAFVRKHGDAKLLGQGQFE